MTVIEKKKNMPKPVRRALDSMAKMAECWELADKYVSLSDQRIAEILLKEDACSLCKFKDACDTSMDEFI